MLWLSRIYRALGLGQLISTLACVSNLNQPQSTHLPLEAVPETDRARGQTIVTHAEGYFEPHLGSGIE